MKSSLEMHGFQICLLHLNAKSGDTWLELLDAPTDAPCWPGGEASIRRDGGIGDDESLLQTDERKVRLLGLDVCHCGSETERYTYEVTLPQQGWLGAFGISFFTCHNNGRTVGFRCMRSVQNVKRKKCKKLGEAYLTGGENGLIDRQNKKICRYKCNEYICR